ncbi:TPA: hypothetical protein N0F65_009652 [Lagenidium giganteum]|uniref:Uncharacterized protein n=1 Tax=Lagenidium giganteum TaxID=4803 RepID=A0AAV2YJK4_9STRA|nr:TPA: hypothetical protein N0F65_009652 [Lagenidium giganteum]
MEDAGDDHAHANAGAGTSASASKDGLQLLHELLAIVYHVFEEAKHMNLKPPLQPSSKLFSQESLNALGAGSSSPRSPGPPDSPQEDGANTAHTESNGVSMHPPSGGIQQVIPFTPEEIQDSYTKIATLKNHYIRISTELQEKLQQLEQPAQVDDQKEKEQREKLIQRRDQLRKEVYERNLVMKGLIDRLRHLQHSIRLVRGGSAFAPNVVMESKRKKQSPKKNKQPNCSTMVVPPSYAKALSVKNTTSHTVRVTAVFGSDEQEAQGKKRITLSRVLAPQASVDFDEQEYDMGSWKAIAAVDSVEVVHEPGADSTNLLGKAVFRPSVSGIVARLHTEVTVNLTGSSPQSLQIVAK